MSRGRGGNNRKFGRPRGVHGKSKRKQLNLLTIRQKRDFQELGDRHPVEERDDVKSYTRVEDTPSTKANMQVASSSDESENEEVPSMKQLMEEMGVQEEEPQSEQEGESDDDDEEGEGGSDGEEEGEEDDEEESENDEEEIEDEIKNDEHGLDSDHERDEEEDDDIDSEDDDDDEGQIDVLSKEDGKPMDADDSDEDSGPPKKRKRLSRVKNGRGDKKLHENDGSDEDSDGDVTQESATEEVKQTSDDGGESDDDDEGGNDEDSDDDELLLKESDPFTQHFELEKDLTDIAEKTDMKWKKTGIKVPGLGESVLMYKDGQHLPEPETSCDLQKLHVKQRLCAQARATNMEFAKVTTRASSCLTRQQEKLFRHMNTYQDLLYPKEDTTNMEEIRFVYCLHAVNHILKTRSRIIAHNTKLKARKDSVDDDVEYRDQGLTRPKVLIMLPYRDRALKVVQMIISLLSSSQQASVSNLKRFESEFSEMEDSDISKNYKTEDFKKMFEGNTDDNFRVGLSISKKSVRLYSPFYDSDVILASPLGLRTVIGLEGDKERDFDFLSSIEVLITDQTDVYLMQNWDHFTHVFKHLHLQPKEAHGVDFSRVRMWSINGWSKIYRQTLMFSSIVVPEILTVFNKSCHNYTGKLLVQREAQTGTIKASLSDAPQIFHQVSCDSPDGLAQRQAKLQYLKKKIIPYHTSAGMKQTLIYCNYYSFVMLRNHFREAEVDFLFINEYDTTRHVRNARIHFRKRHPHFMLYTERLHFHYRFRLRGIHHVLWFDLPTYPNFYPELVNLMETSHHACTTTALFTRYEGQKLMELVGKKQAALIMNSAKSTNMITVS